jgi:D-alanyl-D-alanine carboxypeptidase (penicillin-binding protein 5/6)
MRKFWCLAIFLFFCTQSQADLVLSKAIEAEHVILINGNTGRVLFEKNADHPCYPASTTKIAIVLFSLIKNQKLQNLKIRASKDALATITPYEKMRSNYTRPAHWIDSDAGGMDIKIGEEVLFEDLLYATLIASMNDAPNVLAEYFGNGSIPAFMNELNLFLKGIGCKNTHFCTPHGLFHPDHVTTARDMARLSQYAMKNPLFCKIASTLQYERKPTNKQPKMLYVNTNRLLRQGTYFYPYAVGIKTGYHSKAKYTFVAAAEKEGRLLIAAIMRSKDKTSRFQDAKTLFDAAFSEEKVTKELLPVGEQLFTKAIEGAKTPLSTYTKEALEISYYPSEYSSKEPTIRCELVWKKQELPIEKDQLVGTVRVLLDTGEEVSASLYANARVERSWAFIIKQNWILTLSFALLLVVISFYVIFRLLRG